MGVSLTKPRHRACHHSDYHRPRWMARGAVLTTTCQDCEGGNTFGFLSFEGAPTGTRFVDLVGLPHTWQGDPPRSYWISVDHHGRGAHRLENAA